jgi:hypothetical protein
MAMNLDALLRIKAQVDGLPQIARLGKSLGNLDRRADALTSGLGGLVGGFGALTGALTAIAAGGALKGVMDTFSQYQADILGLEQGLKNLGGSASQNLEPLKQLASDLGEQTLFNEEDFNKGFALLTSFGNIAVEQYGRVAMAASDVAQISGTDVQAAMMQLAKALNAPTQGVSALARSGIQFTDAQKDVIKELENTGRIAEAQQLIFKELEKQYGGTSVAAAGGFAGALDTMGEKLYDVQKAMGPMIEDALKPFVAVITEGADVLGNELLPAINSLPSPVKTFAAALAGLTAGFVALKFAMQGVIAITTSAAWASLLAAGPWIALAAGITAAAVALGSYRTESQKLSQSVGSAARGGGAADMAKARNRIVELQQEISLAERQQEERAGGAGGGGGRGGQRSGAGTGLASLRAELRRLQQDVAVGEQSAATVAVTLPTAGADAAAAGGGGGTRAKKDTAAKEAERAAEAALKERQRVAGVIRDRMAEAEIMKLKSEQQDRIAAAERAGDQMLVARLRGQERELDIQYRYAQELMRENDLEAQKAIIYQGQVEMVANQREIERDLNRLAFEAQQKLLEGLDIQAQKQREVKTAMEQQAEAADGIATTLGQGMASAFDGLITGAENWGESLRQIAAGALQDIAKQLIRIYVIEQAISAIKTFLSPASGDAMTSAANNLSGTGALATPIPGLAVGARANGGPVMGGSPYLVGERGPELFVPGRTGMIVPNNQLSSGTNVTVNVDASGSSVQGNDQQAGQLGRAIAAAVQQELVKQKRPGGLLAA